MASKIRAKKVSSLKQLKSSLKSGSGQYLDRIPDGEKTVRFLTEPTEWIDYSEHYDEVNKFYPCTVGDCPGCLEGSKPSSRYLSAALDRDEDRVIPLVLPKSLAGILTRRYDRYQTLLDRDYIIEREGTGFDTSYDATPEAPTKIRLSKYDIPDLWALLEAQLTNDDDDDDEDEDEAPAKSSVKKRASKKPEPVEDIDDEDDDEDLDDEDDDDEDSDDLARDRLDGLGIRELKVKAKEAGVSAADLKGKSKDEVIDLILGEPAVDEDDDDEDDDEDEDEAPTSKSDDSDSDDLTEEDLEAMSLAELKGICKEYGVKVPRGADKDTLIDLLLEETEDDE